MPAKKATVKKKGTAKKKAAAKKAPAKKAPAAKKKAAPAAASKDGLVELAKQMNSVMALNPPINTKLGVEKLTKTIVATACDEEDGITAEEVAQLVEAEQALLKSLVESHGLEIPEPSAKTPKADQTGKGDKGGSKPPKKGGIKKVGVIATIVEVLQKGKPVTKDQIHKVLTTKFPDRSEKGLRNTINCQLGGKGTPRLTREKNIKLTVKDGKYQVKK